MSTARRDFVERIRAFDKAAREAALLFTNPADTSSFCMSRLLRNGLAVAGYAILEDFIRSRTRELLHSVKAPTVAFSELPDRLRIAATEGALRALKFKSDMMRRQGENVEAFIAQESAILSAVRGTGYSLSPLSYFSDASNLSADDIKEMLEAINVQPAWGGVQYVAHQAGFAAVVVPLEAFRNASQRRHSAAHDASFDTPPADLQNFKAPAVAIALGFDALSTHAIRLLLARDADYMSGRKKVQGGHVPMRFVECVGGRVWREIKKGHSRANQRSEDKASLLRDALDSAKRNGELLVVKDELGNIDEWHVEERY